MLYIALCRGENQPSAAGARESRCTIRGLEQRLSLAPAALAGRGEQPGLGSYRESRYRASAARARRTSRCSGSDVGFGGPGGTSRQDTRLDWVAQGAATAELCR